MRARIVALAAALWRARAADEAALAASVSTDASGLFTLGYYWYGILRQPSFHEEFEKCYDALELDGYYGYGLVAYCQFLDYFIEDSAMCKSNYKYMCEEDTRIKLQARTRPRGRAAPRRPRYPRTTRPRCCARRAPPRRASSGTRTRTCTSRWSTGGSPRRGTPPSTTRTRSAGTSTSRATGTTSR